MGLRAKWDVMSEPGCASLPRDRPWASPVSSAAARWRHTQGLGRECTCRGPERAERLADAGKHLGTSSGVKAREA